MNLPPSKPARRGRPPRSRTQAEASRSLILESARKLFAAEGYEGVSMRKIAALAQCSPATLYTLFPNKRQLLRHIWEAVFADLASELERVDDAHTPPERLAALCLAVIDFWLQRPDDYRAIFLVQDRLQGADDHYFVESSDVLPQLAVVRAAIVDAQQRGELRPGDPDEMQNILLCGIQGVALNLITIPEYPWGDPDALKQAMVQTLIVGLR